MIGNFARVQASASKEWCFGQDVILSGGSASCQSMGGHVTYALSCQTVFGFCCRDLTDLQFTAIGVNEVYIQSFSQPGPTRCWSLGLNGVKSLHFDSVAAWISWWPMSSCEATNLPSRPDPACQAFFDLCVLCVLSSPEFSLRFMRAFGGLQCCCFCTARRLIEAHLDVLAFLLDDVAGLTSTSAGHWIDLMLMLSELSLWKVLRLIRNCIQHEFEAVLCWFSAMIVVFFKFLLTGIGWALNGDLAPGSCAHRRWGLQAAAYLHRQEHEAAVVAEGRKLSRVCSNWSKFLVFFKFSVLVFCCPSVHSGALWFTLRWPGHDLHPRAFQGQHANEAYGGGRKGGQLVVKVLFWASTCLKLLERAWAHWWCDRCLHNCPLTRTMWSSSLQPYQKLQLSEQWTAGNIYCYILSLYTAVSTEMNLTHARCVVQLLLIDMLQDAVSQHYEWRSWVLSPTQEASSISHLSLDMAQALAFWLEEL